MLIFLIDGLTSDQLSQYGNYPNNATLHVSCRLAPAKSWVSYVSSTPNTVMESFNEHTRPPSTSSA